MGMALEFLSNEEGLNRSSSMSKVSKEDQIGPLFDLTKVSQININFELLIASKMTSLKIYIYLQSRRS